MLVLPAVKTPADWPLLGTTSPILLSPRCCYCYCCCYCCSTPQIDELNELDGREPPLCLKRYLLQCYLVQFSLRYYVHSTGIPLHTWSLSADTEDLALLLPPMLPFLQLLEGHRESGNTAYSAYMMGRRLLLFLYLAAFSLYLFRRISIATACRSARYDRLSSRHVGLVLAESYVSLWHVDLLYILYAVTSHFSPGPSGTGALLPVCCPTIPGAGQLWPGSQRSRLR